MNRTLAALSLLFSVSYALAHDHHHNLCPEELVKIIEKQERIIAKQKESIECLECELDHIKHKLHKDHRYHAIKRVLHELFG